MQLGVLIQGQDGATVAGHHTGGCSLGTSTGSVWGEQTGPCAPLIFDMNFI
jgi:hypothetical protein